MNVANYRGTKHYVTAEGMEKLRQQLEGLKCSRSKLASELRNLSSQNDISSAMYDQAQIISYGQVGEINRQIGLLEHIIAKAQIITKPDKDSGVSIGSTVIIAIEGKRKTYAVVGSIEADPLNGKISDESPLGRSLLGKKVGDRLYISTISRRVEAEIVDIC